MTNGTVEMPRMFFHFADRPTAFVILGTESKFAIFLYSPSGGEIPIVIGSNKRFSWLAMEYSQIVLGQ